MASGHDEDRALALYVWNARLGESFHLPIQAVEIALRNRVNDVLTVCYGAEWWKDANFLAVADRKQISSLDEVKQRITRRNGPMVTGQIVAGLSFGFWVSSLDRRFNPTVWSAHLRRGFPHLPHGVKRGDLQTAVRSIADFRNRIWHHEPIFKDNISERYSHCMKTLGWLCPTKVAWIRPQCAVMAVLRAKP
jgi:hypothetical protein